MTEAPKNGEKLVGALTAGLKVLRYMVRVEGAVGVSQVARELSISPSTCFNLLRTLVHERLLEFDPVKKTYSIGLGLLELTMGMIERDRIIQFLRPRLEQIAAAHRVTTTLWRKLDSERVVLVDRADAAAAVRVHMTVGQRLPMFVGALGRCMAAQSDLGRDELRTRFENLRWERPPEFEDYWQDVQIARERGFAVDQDNFVRGITSIAVPVTDRSGSVVMIISAIGFSGQFTEPSLSALADDLCRHASEISGAAGEIAARRLTRGARGQEK